MSLAVSPDSNRQHLFFFYSVVILQHNKAESSTPGKRAASKNQKAGLVPDSVPVKAAHVSVRLPTKGTTQFRRLLLTSHTGSGKGCDYKRLEFKDNAEKNGFQ